MSKANALEQQMLDLINAERAKVGVDPLTFNDNLNGASEEHSKWMLQTNTFSHTGPGGNSADQRMEAAGYKLEGNALAGENIGWQSERGAPGLADDVVQVHQGLMDSPGHRANILNPDYKEIGIGIERGDFTDGSTFDAIMVTQNFGTTEAEGTPAPAPTEPGMAETVPDAMPTDDPMKEKPTEDTAKEAPATEDPAKGTPDKTDGNETPSDGTPPTGEVVDVAMPETEDGIGQACSSVDLTAFVRELLERAEMAANAEADPSKDAKTNAAEVSDSSDAAENGDTDQFEWADHSDGPTDEWDMVDAAMAEETASADGNADWTGPSDQWDWADMDQVAAQMETAINSACATDDAFMI